MHDNLNGRRVLQLDLWSLWRRREIDLGIRLKVERSWKATEHMNSGSLPLLHMVMVMVMVMVMLMIMILLIELML